MLAPVSVGSTKDDGQTAFWGPREAYANPFWKDLSFETVCFSKQAPIQSPFGVLESSIGPDF